MFMNKFTDLNEAFLSLGVKKQNLRRKGQKMQLTREEDFVDGREDIFDLIVKSNRNGL